MKYPFDVQGHPGKFCRKIKIHHTPVIFDNINITIQQLTVLFPGFDPDFIDRFSVFQITFCKTETVIRKRSGCQRRHHTHHIRIVNRSGDDPQSFIRAQIIRDRTGKSHDLPLVSVGSFKNNFHHRFQGKYFSQIRRHLFPYFFRQHK